MVVPLDMNDNRITGLTNNVLYLTKVAINSMLTMRLQKEILVILQKKYLMDDVNEWSTEWCGMVLTLRKLMI